MSNKTPYTYTVLRYVHDIASGEFLNVGVAILAPERRYVVARCQTRLQRLKSVFPTLDSDSLRAAMRHVNQEFVQFQQELSSEFQFRAAAKSVMHYAHSVLGADDSSLQWAPMGSGLTENPAKTLEHLFQRFVPSKDRSADAPQRRQDADVWRHFSHELQQRQVLKYLGPKTITVRDDELAFEHAWKNGVWHCLAPVSFDLASSESIREKAHRWLGQLTSVASAQERFKLYFLVGSPSQDDLMPAFEAALSILNKAPVEREVYTEAAAHELSVRLATEVEVHLRHAPDG